MFVAAVEESANRLGVVAKAEGPLFDDPLGIVWELRERQDTPGQGIWGQFAEVIGAQTEIDPNNGMELADVFKF